MRGPRSHVANTSTMCILYTLRLIRHSHRSPRTPPKAIRCDSAQSSSPIQWHFRNLTLTAKKARTPSFHSSPPYLLTPCSHTTTQNIIENISLPPSLSHTERVEFGFWSPTVDLDRGYFTLQSAKMVSFLFDLFSFCILNNNLRSGPNSLRFRAFLSFRSPDLKRFAVCNLKCEALNLLS